MYFYQLGLKIGLSRMIAGGISLGLRDKSGIDLPDEKRALWPYAVDYYNKTYGARGWSNAVTLNLSIGQGENSQTVVNMAKFYAALATDGNAPTPEIVKRAPVKTRIFKLDQEQMDGLRTALAGVIGQGTAQSARIQGIMLAGKTGTAQTGKRVNGVELNHAWFVGFAPADKPTIVVAVMLEYGGHGGRAAHVASSIIAHYLKVAPVTAVQSEG